MAASDKKYSIKHGVVSVYYNDVRDNELFANGVKLGKLSFTTLRKWHVITNGTIDVSSCFNLGTLLEQLNSDPKTRRGRLNDDE